MWGQTVDHVAGFQDGYPRASRVVRYPSIIGKTPNVKHLTYSSGAQPYESLKQVKVLHGGNLMNVALNVRPDVISVPVYGIEGTVVQRWVLVLEKAADRGKRC